MPTSANSPEVVVPARTMIAPAGGLVRDVAEVVETKARTSRAVKSRGVSIARRSTEKSQSE